MPANSAHDRPATARMLALLCSTALTSVTLAAMPAPARAQLLSGATGGQGDANGGAGGNAGEAGSPGTGATAGGGGSAGTVVSPDGGTGGDDFSTVGSAGGGGGGYSHVTTGNISASSTGGNGGAGGLGLNGGGGGAGGDGARNAEAVPNVRVGATVRGGHGGGGYGLGSSGGGGAGIVLENAGTLTFDPGGQAFGGNGGGGFAGGGGGGAGVILNAGGTLNTGAGTSITGGAGGYYSAGGAGVISGGATSVVNLGEITGGAGGDAGPAGAALDLRHGGTVLNIGTIRGGAGDSSAAGPQNAPAGGTGSGGARGFVPFTASAGSGGAGIVGAGLSVMNAGTIAGGVGMEGRANAITFTGGDNTLSLRNGSTIIGNVVVESGAVGTLVLGDYDTLPSTPAFDVSKIVTTATAGATDQFVGFGIFLKSGSNTVRLTGTGAQSWTIEQGALAGDTNSLGGNLTFTGASGIARGVVFDQASDGTYAGTVSGPGDFVKTGAASLTLTSPQSFTGEVNIFGGTLRMGAANVLGASAGIHISGGSWDLDGYSQTVKGLSGNVGTSIALGAATLTVDNTSFAGFSGTISGTGGLTKTGAGDFNLFGTHTYSGPTNVTGGAMRLGGLLASATINISNGAEFGVYRENALSPIVAVNLTGTASIFRLQLNQQIGSLSGGAGTEVRFDTGAVLTTGTNNTNDVFGGNIGGTISVDGALTKIGTGSLTLNGDSEYGGATTVRGGALIVNGSLSPLSAVTVEAGATLGGSGTVGHTIIADGGHIAPGHSIGTLHFSRNLTLSPGSILDFELGSPGLSAGAPGTSDRIAVGGSLTLDGTLNLSQSGHPADGMAAFGYYRLMTYGGTLIDRGLEIGATPVAGIYEIQAGGGNVDLFVAANGDNTLQHWQGDDGTWNAVGTQWLNQGGVAPVAWAGHHAVFKNEPGGFGGGTIAVAGVQSFKGLQFVDNGYRLEGPGTLMIDGSGRSDGNAEIRVLTNTVAHIATTITGTGGLSKTEGGTLVLEGNNTYRGGTSLLDGTLSVSSDANLGDAAGGLRFNGGTLATTAGIQSARAIMLDGSGVFNVATNTELGLTGSVSGAGDLIKIGAGTLRLTGVNSYGNTAVLGGTLIGSTGSISGDIINAGTVVFDQPADGRFAGNIGRLSSFAGLMVKQGAGTLSLTGISGLDWSIQAGGLSAVAERFLGNAAIGAGASLTFDQAADAAYGGVLTGTGRFVKAGTGALIYDGNSSGFAGMTEIAAGALIVGSGPAHAQAMLGGSFHVAGGGTLGGHGTVGSGAGSVVTIASGGTIAPGNSIGTLTVNGNLVFAAGSTYQAEISPALQSDLINVSGTAVIDGGTVHALKAGGIYTPGSRWTILDAHGGVTGRFDAFDQNMPFVDLTLSYDAHRVYIEAKRNSVPFCAVAQTANQCAIGKGLESTGSGNPANDAAAALPDATAARAALDQLSGEIHASAKTALIADSRFIREAATDRIRAAFGAVAASAMPVTAYGEGGPQAVPVTTDRAAVWAQGFGAWGRVNGNGNAAGLTTATGGILIGADGPVFGTGPFGTWRFGALAGYSRTTFNARGRLSSGESDNYHLGLYGGTQWGPLGFRAGLAYTWHQLVTGRTVAFAGFGDSLRSRYRAGTFQVFGDIGYRIDTPVAAFEPFANLAHVSLDAGGCGERGGAAALHATGQVTAATFTTIGLRASANFALGGIAATVRGSIGWRHAYGAIAPLSSQAFAGGDAFAIAGVPIARDAGAINAGLDMAVTPNAVLGLSYDGQFASSAQQHGFKANFSLRF
ncbi:Extracellular serine protease precursor [bacterium YEK0313]|nr:Extracellular serine protease precursor [bacterium YEK0313]